VKRDSMVVRYVNNSPYVCYTLISTIKLVLPILMDDITFKIMHQIHNHAPISFFG